MSRTIQCKVEVIARTKNAVLLAGQTEDDEFFGKQFREWFPLKVCDEGGAEPWDPERGTKATIWIPMQFLDEKGILN